MLAILILATHRTNERKHGLYPTVVEYHKQLGIDFYLHLIGNDATQGHYEGLGGKKLLGSGPHTLPRPKLDAFFLAALRYQRDLSQIREHIVRAGKPELIVALTSSPIAGTVAYLAGREHEIPFVVWEHLTHYQRNMLRGMRLKRRIAIMNAAETILTVSESLNQSLQFNLGLESKKLEVMPNPIPSDFIGRLPHISQKYKNLPTDCFAFGAWTNWRTIKRLDILLTAFARVRAKHPKTVLLVAGPVAKNVFRSIEPALLTQPGLTLLNSVPRREIMDLARQVACCVVPSDHETFGLPALEAMAMGKPVITTRSGGPEHLVTPANGVVVERGCASSLAAAMIAMLENYEVYDPQLISRIAHDAYGPTGMKARWKRFYERFDVIDTHEAIQTN